MTDPDPSDLSRFVDAQSRLYPIALAELQAGEKRSHWMWYVFPQLRGLGFSPKASLYGIVSADEASAYLRHALLGPRLAACAEAVLGHAGTPLRAIFGTPDDLKFRSSMTLFEHASGGADPFRAALERCCGGERDARTLALLAR